MRVVQRLIILAGIFILLNVNLVIASPSEWQIIYDVSYQALDESSRTEKTTVTPKEIIIGLGENYFYTGNDWEKNIYDFAGRRIISLDQERKFYTSNSLFSQLAFTLHFFEMRLSLADTMGNHLEKDKTLADNKDLDPFEIETVFSLESGRVTRPVIEKVENDTVKYTVNGEIVAEATFSGEKLEYPFQNTWAKYLMYKHNLHPSIRRNIAVFGSIPRLLTYRFTDSTTYRCTMQLKTVRFIDNSEPLIPAGYSLHYESQDDLGVIMHQLKTKQTGPSRLSKEQLLTTYRKAYEKEKYLDALLILYELNYQTGEWPGKEMEKILPHAKTNRPMALFTDALYRKQPQEKGISLLDQINRDRLSRGYIIDIFKAEILKNHDYKTAESLYVRALKSNPYLISVYTGLAEVYHKQAKMTKAWDCWDLARSLDPAYPGLEYIKEYEKNLLISYPEFF